MKTKTKLLALLLVAAMPMFLSCGQHVDAYVTDGINWDGSASGTLELVNGSNKDLIVFVGQTPAQSTILGGVRAGATVMHDISPHVADFNVGGYAILRGISKEEWDNNPDPSKAKIEFNAMVTYRAGAVYRYNINPSYLGDNGFKVTNRFNLGIELRKDSPEGEKVAYLPALQQNQMVYTQTTEAIYLFPVYVYYNKTTGEVTTLKATSVFAGNSASPRPLGPNSQIQTYYFPNDEKLTWDYIVGTLKQYAAYVTVRNNIPNQSGYVTNALSTTLRSQNGYESIGAGEMLVFEVPSTDEGIETNLTVVYYGGAIKVPVLLEDRTVPVLRNGYDYSVSVTYTAGEGGIENQANYKAVIKESEKPRDVSDQIKSL